VQGFRARAARRLRAPSTDAGIYPLGYQEFIEAFDRTERLGMRVPMRLLVERDCVDRKKLMPVLLEYFLSHDPQDLIGKTLMIKTDLVQLLYETQGIPFYLTTGWMEKNAKPFCQHDETRILMFLKEGLPEWQREGVSFHLWLTSPALEILDLTFAMNLG
jgi:hypothetical protein